MATAAAAVITRPIAPEQASLWSDAWRRLRRNRLALAGVIFLTLVVIVALVSLVWTPYSTFQVGVGIPYSGPGAHHLLGVDGLGRDTLSRLMAGAQISLVVGIGTQILVLAVGVPIRLAAGFFPGPLYQGGTLLLKLFFRSPRPPFA